MSVLSKKLAWLAIWVTGFAVVMTGLLLYFKYQGVLTSLQRERVGVVLKDIDGIAETSLALGQGFADIGALQEVIERRVKADSIIERIDILAADGKVVYTSVMADIGSTSKVFPDLPGGPKTSQARWLTRTDHAVGTLPISNHYGVTVGHSVVRYSRATEKQLVGEFVTRLVITCGAVFLAAVVLLFLALRRIESSTEAGIAEAGTALTDAAGSDAEAGIVREAQLRLHATRAALDKLAATLPPRVA